jgi:2'-5' RNA ligase
LDGFAAFAPRVLYIHVQPSVGLTRLRTLLRDRLQQHPVLKLPANPRHSYPFVPHITVGFRDLSPENFERAWAEFQQRSFQANFIAEALTLLQHNGQHWEPIASYPLTGIRDSLLTDPELS